MGREEGVFLNAHDCEGMPETRGVFFGRYAREFLHHILKYKKTAAAIFFSFFISDRAHP